MIYLVQSKGQGVKYINKSLPISKVNVNRLQSNLVFKRNFSATARRSGVDKPLPDPELVRESLEMVTVMGPEEVAAALVMVGLYCDSYVIGISSKWV